MKKSMIQWQDYIDTSLKKTAAATLETAGRIQKFKESTDPDLFSKHMKDWFGMTPTHLSYWSKINDNMPRFTDSIGRLPSGTRTLYELSSITDDLWEELIETNNITPALTVEAAKGLRENGGLVKRVAKIYEDANEFLEIITQLKKIKENTDTIKEAEKAFNKWIKENPPTYLTEDEDETIIEEDEIEVIENHGVTSATRIKCLKLFGIDVNAPITDPKFLGFLRDVAGSQETLLNAIHTLEQE